MELMNARYMTEVQQRQLLAAPKACADVLAQRDYHCFASLILTGMRIQEWTRLTAPMVRMALSTGWLVSLREHCKGRRRANQYLVTDALQMHLEALLQISAEQGAGVPEPEGGAPLVWGRDIAGRMGALSVRSYQVRLKHWAQVAGLDPRISPHWLRHTRGMNIMRKSRGHNPLKVAQIALNHSTLSSTSVYLRMSREEYERELRAVDGGRLPKRVARRLAEGGRA